MDSPSVSESGESWGVSVSVLHFNEDKKIRLYMDPVSTKTVKLVTVERCIEDLAMSAAREHPEKHDTSETLDFDTILLRDIGKFGLFQVKLMLLCLFVAVFSAWVSAEFLFTTARIPTRCLIPECDPEIPEFSPWWAYRAIPQDNGALDNCRRFAGNSSAAAAVVDTCPAHLFDQTTLQRCHEYVYENTDTIVYDFDLACDEWRRTLIGSIRTIGVFLSIPITATISDHWGRRTALIFNAVNCAWLGVVRYWASSYVGFLISEVVEALLGSGIYTSAYIILIEVTAKEHRTAAGAYMGSCFALGQMTLAFIAWGIPNWQNLTLALYVPQFLSIGYFWITTESVRWYMSKGKYQKAEAALHKIARTNRKTLSAECLEALKRLGEEDAKLQAENKERAVREPWLIVLVFQYKKMLVRCAVTPVWWITNRLIYTGLSIIAVTMVGNAYLNYAAVSIVEIPAFWVAVPLMNRIGRKLTLIAGYLICAACQFAYVYVSNANYGVALTFYLLGKCAISVVSTTLSIYTAELYPTRYRHSFFGYNSMMGRIGTMIAPLMPALSASTFEEVPFVVFGSLALISGVLMFITPETLGTNLPDTIEEAENLGNKTTSSL